ncbi:hypothetical protein Tco_1044276 [Tanacetum coccineum]|uniref:Uncharacterized protein n=1 Tax=Tanacetum coccineum TaxID=301880 RepID=A0ABQ5GPG5_9ASTR
MDPPPPTCQFQVFRSLCKSIGLRSVIRFDAQELKKVIWYVLHNSPEIDTYRSQFKSKFPNKDMKEEFPDWFGSQIRQRHVDNDPGVSATSELFALACGPTPTPISVNSCVVNGVRFVVHNRDERRTTQNSGICSPGGKDGEMYYGQLQEILEFLYLSFKVVLFRMSADVVRGHSGDGGGDDRPLTYHIPTGYEGCFANRGKGTRKPNLGGRKAGRLHTRQETRNLGLKKITDDKGPVPVQLEWDDKKTMMPLGDHASHWQRRSENITPTDWDAQLAFWNDPRNLARAAQNRQNRPKSTVVCRQGSRSLALLRDQMIESSSTREYSSLIHTFFMTHTLGGVFVRDEDRALYSLGNNTETGVPYTEEEIMAIVRKGKQRGHLPGVGRVLSGRATGGCPPPPQSTVDPADVEKLKKSNKSLTKQVKMMMRLFRSDDKFSQMLDQFQSSPEFGGASGSGRCEDDEPGGDKDGDEDEEGEEDGDS